MDHSLQTPAMLHVELKGAQLPPGLEQPRAVQEDRIQVQAAQLQKLRKKTSR